MPKFRLSFTGQGKCLLKQEGAPETREFDEIPAVITFIRTRDVNHDSTLTIYDKLGKVRFKNLLSHR